MTCNIIDADPICTNSIADWTELVRWEEICWITWWITIFIKTGNGLKNVPGMMCKCDCWRGRGVGRTHCPGGTLFLTVYSSPDSLRYNSLAIKLSEILYSSFCLVVLWYSGTSDPARPWEMEKHGLFATFSFHFYIHVPVWDWQSWVDGNFCKGKLFLWFWLTFSLVLQY